jgi:hypothetical protein
VAADDEPLRLEQPTAGFDTVRVSRDVSRAEMVVYLGCEAGERGAHDHTSGLGL